MTTDCGLVDATISASEKDLPVNKSQSIPNFFFELRPFTSSHYFLSIIFHL